MENINCSKKVPCTIKLVQGLFNYNMSKSTAQRKIQLVRDALDKQHPKIITMDEFEEFYF
jgi:hypothetical protein